MQDFFKKARRQRKIILGLLAGSVAVLGFLWFYPPTSSETPVEPVAPVSAPKAVTQKARVHRKSVARYSCPCRFQKKQGKGKFAMQLKRKTKHKHKVANI